MFNFNLIFIMIFILCYFFKMFYYEWKGVVFDIVEIELYLR